MEETCSRKKADGEQLNHYAQWRPLGIAELGQNDSANGMLPGGINSLYEPLFTYHM